MAKVCKQCGREFEDRSVRCPICKLDLISTERDNSTERQRMQKARQDRQARYARGAQTQEMQEVRDTQDGYRQSLRPQPTQKSKNEQKTLPGQATNINRLRKYRIVIICTGILFGLLGFKCLVNGNFICCVFCVLCMAGTKKMKEKIYGVDYITSCSKCGRGIKGSFFDGYVTIRYKNYCSQCAELIPSCDKCKYHYKSYFYPRFGCCAHFNQYLQDYDNVCDYYEKGEPIHPDVSV